MTTASRTTRSRRGADRGVRIGLAPCAPPALEVIVRSLLATDEPLEGLEPLGTPGQNTRLAKLVVETGEGPRRYAVKRYAWPILAAVRTFGHATRARSEFQALEALEPLVPSPIRAAAWGEKRALGFALRSVLVTELLEDAIDLKAWRLAFARGERPRAERERLVAALPELARLMRRLHDAGFFAANAFQKNVLWRPHAPASEAFSLVDLPFARRSRRPLAARRRLYDLACLDKDASMVLSSSERLRFFLAYEGRPSLEPGDRARLRRVSRERARREHATFFSRIERSVKKTLKRTSVGKLLVGRDPEERNRKSR